MHVQAVRSAGTDPCGRELQVALSALVARRDEIAASINEAILLEVPVFASTPELIEGSGLSTVACIDEFLTMIECDGDPTAVTPPAISLRFARDLVHLDVPFTMLLRKYRVGQAAFSRHMLDQLGAQIDDRALFEEAVRRSNDLLFTFVDTVADSIVEEYLRERGRWHRSAAAAQAETVAAILDGRLDDPELASRRLGHRVGCRQLAYVVWGDEELGGTVIEDVAREFGRALGCERALVLPATGGAASCWIAADRPFELDAILSSLPFAPARAAGVRIAVGEPGLGLEGFRDSCQEARRARHVALLVRRPSGSVTRYGQVALSSLLLHDVEGARRFVSGELGELAGDDDGARRVAATLRVYLEEDSSPVRASRRLGIHPNTVAYRVRRAEAMLGHPVTSRPLELQVALALMKYAAPAA